MTIYSYVYMSHLCMTKPLALATVGFSQISTATDKQITSPEEQMKYKKLMNTLAWFFFKLLAFEYIEDAETGLAFRLPGGYQWKIFVEVCNNSSIILTIDN